MAGFLVHLVAAHGTSLAPGWMADVGLSLDTDILVAVHLPDYSCEYGCERVFRLCDSSESDPTKTKVSKRLFSLAGASISVPCLRAGIPGAMGRGYLGNPRRQFTDPSQAIMG